MAQCCGTGSPVPASAASADNYESNTGTAGLSHNTVDLGRSRCYGSRPVIKVQQNQPAILKLWVADRNGQAVNLSGTFTIRFIVKDRENSSFNILSVVGEIVDEQTGEVKVALPACNTLKPGIYVAQVLVQNDDEEVLWATPYWLTIEPSLSSKPSAALTIAEIRLMMRDVCGEQNVLLGDLEYDDSQIVACLRLPIDEFNEKYQPKTAFSTRTFPYRFHWMRAVCGYLLEIAGRGYARDHLPYSAGGVSVDDKNKAGPYMSMAQSLLLEWRTFIKERKVEMNIESSYGTLGSYYGYVNW